MSRPATRTGPFYTAELHRDAPTRDCGRGTAWSWSPRSGCTCCRGGSNLPLAEEIAERLGVELGDANLAEFANGEIHCRFGESMRGADVFIIQSHGASRRACRSTTRSWSS